MAVVHGLCKPAFEPLGRLFSSLVESGRDLGASLAVTLDGEPVVDLWGGWTDTQRTQPWQGDTLTNVWSTTKTMTSLAALVLVDRGELDPDAPVARYWPEFAANGKSGVTVAHILSHASGVPGWEVPMRTEDLFDRERSTALLAAQAPWWTPGTSSGYHALNYGHLVGEVVRRITGRTLGTFFAEEIARPLGADFHIGLADSEFHRVAPVVPPEQAMDLSMLDRSTPMFRTLSNPAPDASASWTAEWKRAEIGACNGHGNARSVARVQSIVANGGEVDGVRLLAPRTIERIFEPRCDGVDLVLGVPLRLGLGWGLPKPEVIPFIPDGKRCFWGGWGGSLALVDAERRMVVSYVMTKMADGTLGGANAAELTACVYGIVGA